jgi:hypothetical protein
MMPSQDQLPWSHPVPILGNGQKNLGINALRLFLLIRRRIKRRSHLVYSEFWVYGWVLLLRRFVVRLFQEIVMDDPVVSFSIED